MPVNNQNVNYDNIHSVINYGKKRIKKGLEFIVDFREKKSNHNNDLGYIQELINFARKLVIYGDIYQAKYIQKVIHEHHNLSPENSYNYYNFMDDYMEENPPKMTHFVLTFNIGEETFTLHYSNRPVFYNVDIDIYWSDNEPNGWPVELQVDMNEGALKQIDLAQKALNKNKAINNVVKKGTKGRADKNISKEIKKYVGGLPSLRRKSKSKSKGGSKKMRKTRRNNKRKTKRQTKKNIKK